MWHDGAVDSAPGPTTATAYAAAVLDWTALEREPHKSALERARHRLAVRRRELLPRLPARSTAGALLGPATLVAEWRLADGALLTLAANLAAAPYAAPPAARGVPLLATTDAVGGDWPPWYVQWTCER
jgi:maltooligosyltrehalose trehalohydrolase